MSDIANYYVACINPDCGWQGQESETVHSTHWPQDMRCPECHEVVEYADR